MDDNRIIELLFERAENALDEVSIKYSRLYKWIIREVLSDEGQAVYIKIGGNPVWGDDMYDYYFVISRIGD